MSSGITEFTRSARKIDKGKNYRVIQGCNFQKLNSNMSLNWQN